MKKIMLLFVVALSSLAIAKDAITKPKIISVEEIFYSGDILHYWADEHAIGDTFKVDILDVSEQKVIGSQIVHVYQYGEHHEFDITIPKIKPGYYSLKWATGRGDKLKVVAHN